MTHAILSALVNGAIAGSLVALVVGLVLLLARRGVLGAAARYVVWWTVLAAVVGLPAAYLPARSPSTVATAPATVSETLPATVARAVTVTVAAPARATRLRFPIIVRVGGWSRWLAMVWAWVSGLMLLRLVASCILLERRKARAVAAPVALAVPLARSARVLSCASTNSPVLAGLWRPAILLPARLFTEMTEEELTQIALHETAHVARRDDWGILALRAVQALLPFHPAVWWVARQIGLERELACDAFVVEQTREARAYAACLVRVVEICGGVRAQWAGAGVESQLGKRVERLLDGKLEARSGTQRVCTAVGLVVLLAFLGLRAPRAIALADVQAPAPMQVAAAPPSPSPILSQLVAPVIVTVQDRAGHDVAGLTKDNFRVYENGVEQSVNGFLRETPPVSVALLVDRSGSMRDKDGLVDAAVLQLVTTANPLDEFLVVTFNDEAQIAGPFGTDVSAILNQVHLSSPRGGTAMRDAILQASRWSGARYRSRSIVVISDGVDNASSVSAEELYKATVPRVWAVTLASSDRYPRMGSTWLGDLARMREGSEFVGEDPGLVSDYVTNLVNPNYYRLQFTPTNQTIDGTFRRIKVEVVDAGPPGSLRIAHRSGYYATGH